MKATDRHYTASARSRAQRRRVIGFTAATMALCVALGVLAAVVLAAKGDTSLISRRSASAGGQGANGDSLSPSVSGTGGAVAFSTEATNLGGPAQNVSNIYVYTRGIRKVSLVSRRSAAAGGQGVNSGAFNPAITPSGRFVAFSTEATNLGGPAHAGSCIYVYDRKSRRVELVSRRSAAAGGAAANGDSFSPSISADGRFVAFDTDATNLGGPTNAGSNVYVYDREQDRVELVSRRSASAGGQGADAAADAPTISGTGRFVAFRTTADNLGGPIQDVLNVYVYDRATTRSLLFPGAVPRPADRAVTAARGRWRHLALRQRSLRGVRHERQQPRGAGEPWNQRLRLRPERQANRSGLPLQHLGRRRGRKRAGP